MPTVVRPNKLQFVVESPNVGREEALDVLTRTLETGVDDVVAGFSEVVDPEDVPSHNPHMLYAAHVDGELALVCQSTFERVDEFLDVVEHVCEEADPFVDCMFRAQFKIDIDVDTDDIDVPEAWEVKATDIPEGTGIGFRERGFAVESGEELTDRFERVREFVADIVPAVEPSGETPTTPVEEYYEIRYGDRLANEGRNHFLQQLFHESGGFATIDTWETKQEGTTLESLDVTVVEEELGAEDIDSLDQRDAKFGTVPRGDSTELLGKLLDGDPKLLEVDCVYEDEGQRVEETELHLVAKADGDWKIVE